MPDMECGFARDLFLTWCTNPKNSIILTSRSSPGTLGMDLINNGGDRVMNLEVKRRIKLTGSELDEYRRVEKEKNKKVGDKHEKKKESKWRCSRRRRRRLEGN